VPLNSTQLAALKTDILANTNTIPSGQPWTGAFAGVQVKDVPNDGDGNVAVAGYYSQVASPTYNVWSPSAQLKAIRSAVDLAKFTPTDAAPASGSTVQATNDALLYQNRALVCQLKQANAIFLIQGEGVVDAAPSQYRLSFFDCMTQVPSGASGASQNAGWGTTASPGAVRLAMMRAATRVEKLFAVAGTGTGNSGNVGGDARGSVTNPDALVVVGSVSPGEVNSALNLA
jgi:hypothetical protein